jgi:hypothetical protein
MGCYEHGRCCDHAGPPPPLQLVGGGVVARRERDARTRAVGTRRRERGARVPAVEEVAGAVVAH